LPQQRNCRSHDGKRRESNGSHVLQLRSGSCECSMARCYHAYE
jgi:hypothetical protein